MITGSTARSARPGRPPDGGDQPLVHEGVGWMLRRAGEVDRDRFLALLDASIPDLSRAAVRPAVEELDPAVRKRFVAASR